MAVEQQLVDTNVLVRYFTGDPPAMAEKARKLINRADAGEVSLVIIPVILAETFYSRVFLQDGANNCRGKIVIILKVPWN